MFREFCRVYAPYALWPVMVLGVAVVAAAVTQPEMTWPLLGVQLAFLALQVVTQVYCMKADTF